MLSITRMPISYTSVELGTKVEHYALIAHVDGKNILLSHANLFLYSITRLSIKTSSRYSSIISMFYRYLSTQEKFAKHKVSKYHILADNRDIRRWQVARQAERIAKQSPKPSSETIYEDAKILLIFFAWLNDSGFITNVDVRKKNWKANFKSNHMLSYIQNMAKIKIDAKNIRVLDKERRKIRSKSLITNVEIKALIESFSDPVYAAMFKLSLGTAMRPMDLCAFPYIGNGKNKHVMPYSEMTKEHKVVDYTMVSKGNKTRKIKINIRDLEALEKHYIIPCYHERATKYEHRYGEKCPPSILFLNKSGVPVTPEMVSSRTNYAKEKAISNQPDFREKITFYEARHWWPTQFLITFFKEKLLTEAADALCAACSDVLANQMGHENLETTFKHYVDMGRLIMLAHEGPIHELIHSPEESVEEFVEKIRQEATANGAQTCPRIVQIFE